MTSDGLQVEADHYGFLRYVTKERWVSYYHQITEVLGTGARSVLVVGVGDGVVVEVLRRNGLRVETLDFDSRLAPDHVGSVEEIGRFTGFECILCAQILEHLPFDRFEPILAAMARAAPHIVLSLPVSAWRIEFRFRVQWRWLWAGVLSIPKAFRRHRFDGQHHWEVGTRGCSRRHVRSLIRRHCLIRREYLVPEHGYHLFHVLGMRSDLV